MSERGLLLALQRLHDDPGFTELVRQDTENTLGIYDLDQEERDTLIQAVQKGDNDSLRAMAQRVGVDWTAEHVHGLGTLSEGPDNTEGQAPTDLGLSGGPGALPGDAYEGTHPARPAGT